VRYSEDEATTYLREIDILEKELDEHEVEE
jgi:hypothetical protein